MIPPGVSLFLAREYVTRPIVINIWTECPPTKDCTSFVIDAIAMYGADQMLGLSILVGWKDERIERGQTRLG